MSITMSLMHFLAVILPRHKAAARACRTQVLGLSLLSALLLFSGFAQAHNPWRDAGMRSTTSVYAKETMQATHERLVSTTFQELKTLLNANTKVKPVISIPLPKGGFARFAFEQTEVLPASLNQKYPNITTYHAVDTQNTKHTGHFTLTPDGLHGLFNYKGKLIFLNNKKNNKAVTKKHTTKKHTTKTRKAHQSAITHTNYFVKDEIVKRDIKPDIFIHTDHADHAHSNHTHTDHHAHSDHAHSHPNQTKAVDTHASKRSVSPYLKPLARTLSSNTLTTYNIAFSTTGEYALAVGGSKYDVLSEMARMLNVVNYIYLRDLNIRFVLAPETEKLIYTDPDSDPFLNNNSVEDLRTNQSVVSDTIDLRRIDLAHLLATGGGGLAYNGVCDDKYKTQATSGFVEPSSDYFYISLVAHEIGHQLGARHTFNGTRGACGSQRTGETAWEIGSGSTIMGYAGICKEDNLNTKRSYLFGLIRIVGSDSFFHIGSILEIKNYTAKKSCGIQSTRANQAPTANAGGNRIIPVATPFKLTGTADDADGDALSYIWEQKQNISKDSRLIDDPNDLNDKPLFRSYTPSASTERYFPALKFVLTGSLPVGENYPLLKRDINLNFTVRDGKGGVATDGATITTDSICPFAVLRPTIETVWTTGRTATVAWDTAGSQFAPINCPKVDISLDFGSQTFNTVLASGVENNGKAVVQVPNQTSDFARVMVACSNNVFYAVNNGGFRINNQAAAPEALLPAKTMNSCANPISPTNPTTSPARMYHQRKATVATSSGGGAIPAWLVAVLLAASMLSACATQKRTHSHTHKSYQQKRFTYIEFNMGNAKRDALAAVAQDDFRLWVTGSRSPSAPGISARYQLIYQKRCGTRFLPNTGDQLRQGQSLTYRRQVMRYAKTYNQEVIKFCRRGAIRRTG